MHLTSTLFVLLAAMSVSAAPISPLDAGRGWSGQTIIWDTNKDPKDKETSGSETPPEADNILDLLKDPWVDEDDWMIVLFNATSDSDSGTEKWGVGIDPTVGSHVAL